MGHKSDEQTSFLNELVECPTQLCWDEESHGAKQTSAKAKRAHANIQQGSLQYQLNTGRRHELPVVHCVNLQAYVKRSSLERQSPSTLSMGSSLCSCLGRLHRPYLSIQWPCFPRHPKSGPSEQSISAIVNSMDGQHKFKPSWQPLVFILLHKHAVQPIQPKGICLVGCPTPKKEQPAGYFQQCSLQAEHGGWETP